MSRLIRAVPAARERQEVLQAIVGAVRAVPRADEAERRDALAFTALALEKLLESVENTASAWERRGYWVKADRFRADWAWLAPIHCELTDCLVRRDWSGAPAALGRLSAHLGGIEPSRRAEAGKPWCGAWDAWRARELHPREE